MTATEQLDRARERFRESAREIEQCSQQEMPRERYFQRFLRLLVGALGARGAAVRMRGDDGSLVPLADEGLATLGALQDPQLARWNEELLAETLSSGQSRCVSTFEGEAGPAEMPYVIVLAPLRAGETCVGVVEVFLRGDLAPASRPGYLQFVEQMAAHAARFLPRGEPKSAPAGRERFWHEFAGLTLELQSSLDFHAVAATAANDGRLLLDCDRVSVVRKRGRKIVVEAISGQDRVNQRANLVCALSELAARVMPAAETVVYDGQFEGLPPQLAAPLADYVAESHARTIVLVPLCEPQSPVQQDAERTNGRDRRNKAFGCLVVEQISAGEPRPELAAQVELVADHVAAALYNARAHQRIFLLPLWMFLGRCREWFYGRKLVKTLLVCAGLMAVGGGLTLVQWDYRVAGEGRLMPAVQREVFAPWDGEVVEIAVIGGQRVERGQTLLRLQNDELQSKLTDVRSSLREKRQERQAIEARIADAIEGAGRDERLRLHGELVDTIIQIGGLEAQEGILARREAALTVTAPIDGVVATFQVEQLLRHRPVQRGELLLEVMDDRGDWRIELEVDEHRMGHLLAARHRRDDGRLPLEFVLATSAEETYRGRLESISTRPVVRPERGSVVRVFSSIDDGRLVDRRIGAEVRAKIDCGRKSLGYVLFGDVIEFIQQRLWL